MPVAFEIIGWTAASLLAWAIIEYVAHRWAMHRSPPLPLLDRRRESHLLHHGFGWQWSKPVHGYVDDGVSPAWNVVGSSPIWLLFGVYVSATAAAVFVAVAFMHGVLWSAAHHEFHRPRGRWFARNRVFRAIERHHRVHHDTADANYGALFAGVIDRAFGTYRSGGSDCDGDGGDGIAARRGQTSA